MTIRQHNKRKLIPVRDWSKYHPWPPEGGLRHYIFHEGTNGFDAVVRRVGRRVLIDEEAFFDWVDNQGCRRRSKSDPPRRSNIDPGGWRQLPWPVDDNYLGRLKACAGRVLEAGLP